MRKTCLVVPALLFAGVAVAQGDGRRDALDPRAKALPVEFRSAFEDYRPFRDQERRDWRKSNDEVGAAGGAGHRPSQVGGEQAGKPQPPDPGHREHGGHK